MFVSREMLVAFIGNLIDRMRRLVRHTSPVVAYGAAEYDPDVLNCRVATVIAEGEEGVFDAFKVDIAGTIRAPSDQHGVAVRICIADFTDCGMGRSVYEQGGEVEFEYNCDLGKLPNAENILADWMSVAQIRCDRLLFASRGRRDLGFRVSIISAETAEQLARAECVIGYENCAPGYIDLQHNVERARTLGVALAFAVGVTDKKLYNCEIEVIKKWARGNIDFSKGTARARRKLEKALKKTVAFFRSGNSVDIRRICSEIAETAPMGVRYDILDFCVQVAGAKGVMGAEEEVVLRDIALWLQVDVERFREMMEKSSAAPIYEVEDADIILGVEGDMTSEQARLRLNAEYRKWNSRVTSLDPAIQLKADRMLNLIAEARNAYVG